MRGSFLALLLLVGSIATVFAHAEIDSPAIRVPGPKHLEVCGQASFSQLTRDPTGHIEEQLPVTSNACELTLCRGMLFEDQPTTSIQQVAAGQQMTMAVDCTIPHGGPANVSLIDTTAGGSGRVIGSFLKTFDDFCPTSGGTPADQSNLQFTLPSEETVGSSCRSNGECVVQLFWATPDFTQNYYYCVDVTMTLLATSASPAPASSSPSVTLPSTEVSYTTSSPSPPSTSSSSVAATGAASATTPLASNPALSADSLPASNSTESQLPGSASSLVAPFAMWLIVPGLLLARAL